jgi:hypothetical protein
MVAAPLESELSYFSIPRRAVNGGVDHNDAHLISLTVQSHCKKS